jgi:hypothetical protein
MLSFLAAMRYATAAAAASLPCHGNIQYCVGKSAAVLLVLCVACGALIHAVVNRQRT